MKRENGAVVVSNPWNRLRQYTPARIALGRAGTSMPTKPHLEFQLAHARARTAVHHELDIPALTEALRSRGYESIVVHSSAESRPVYLQRPDMGRRLNPESRARLEDLVHPAEGCDVAFVIGDGLSALAIEENAVAFIDRIHPEIARHGWRVAPLVIVKEARVAIGDEVGQVLGAQLVVVLIGERPGLSSPDSMGIYMTLKPRVGLTDEARNCISNVRPEGLSYDQAAHKLAFLMTEGRRRGISGVHLKDETDALPTGASGSFNNFLTDGD